MPQGIEIRERMEKRKIVFLGKTTAVAAAVGQLVDAVRLKLGNLDPGYFGDAYVRITTSRRGTATAISATTLSDAAAPFPADGLAGAIVCIGGVYATITSNTTTVLTFAAGWFSAPGVAGATPSLSVVANYHVNWGYVAKVERVDPSSGVLYFNPADNPSVIPAGTDYEVWLHGIMPDAVDRARDRAGVDRCTRWQRKPLSVLPDVSEWSAAIGGNIERLTPQATTYPARFWERSLLVENLGGVGGQSPSFYTSAGQQFVLWGFVSNRSATVPASVSVWNVNAGMTIPLQGISSNFLGRGWQYWCVRFVVPAGCDEIYVRLIAAGTVSVHEWAAVGLLPVTAERLSLPDAVWNDDDVGGFYYIPEAPGGASAPITVMDVHPQPLSGCSRTSAGAGVVVTLPGPGLGYPILYEEARRFQALQSDYNSASGRALGDYATTTARLRYIEAVTLSELLESWPETGGPLPSVYGAAEKDASAYDYRDGAEPRVVEEPRQPRAISWMRL